MSIQGGLAPRPTSFLRKYDVELLDGRVIRATRGSHLQTVGKVRQRKLFLPSMGKGQHFPYRHNIGFLLALVQILRRDDVLFTRAKVIYIYKHNCKYRHYISRSYLKSGDISGSGTSRIQLIGDLFCLTQPCTRWLGRHGLWELALRDSWLATSQRSPPLRSGTQNKSSAFVVCTVMNYYFLTQHIFVLPPGTINKYIYLYITRTFFLFNKSLILRAQCY